MARNVAMDLIGSCMMHVWDELGVSCRGGDVCMCVQENRMREKTPANSVACILWPFLARSPSLLAQELVGNYYICTCQDGLYDGQEVDSTYAECRNLVQARLSFPKQTDI